MAITLRKYNWDYILDRVTEEDLLHKYAPDFSKVGDGFRLRVNDKLPSCNTTYYKGRLWLKDFGDPRYKTAVTIPVFLQEEMGLSEDKLVVRIVRDFKLEGTEPKYRSVPSDSLKTGVAPVQVQRMPTIIDVKYRDWQPHDVEYWGRYGITIEILESIDIRPISYFWLSNHKVKKKLYIASKHAYVFDYYWCDGLFMRKIYQPYNKGLKWLSNCNITVVQNYKTLPKSGDLLVVQSSLKDARVTNLLGYESNAPITENCWFTDSYWDKLKQRWKRIVYYANNDFEKDDNPGLRYGKKISEMYDIPFIHNPDGTASDISDYRDKFGYDDSKVLIDSLINSIRWEKTDT